MGIMDILRKSPPKAADLLFGGPEEREKARKASEEFGTFETLARDVAPYLPQYSDLRAFDPEKYKYFDKNPSDYFNMPMAETSKNRFFPMVMEYTPKDREQDRSFTRLPPGGIAVYGPENATGRVLAHEIRHLRNLDQYKDQDPELVNRIKDLLSSIVSNTPDYDFESFDKSIHKLWCISDKSFIEKLSSVFINEVDNFYIADGHHRMGAMKIIGELNYNKNILHEDFMIAAFPSDETKIFDYNRVVKDLNGLSEEKFLEILSENFEIKNEKNPFKPQSNKQFGMYHEKKWYSLQFKSELKTNNFIDTLDINILNNFIFKKYLNIDDVNNDERIRFIAGCHGLEALEKKVDENNDSVAFSIFPSSISDVITVANKNLTMPPKSTWFDPKPLDGLVVYEFEKSI